MSLQGKAALVTGGGTGVGRATALMLAERGVNVAVNYSRSADEAAQTAADIQAHGVEGLAIQADVASDAAVVAMVEQTVAAFGRLDIVVNSAGTTYFVDYDDLDGMKDEYWDRILAVNLKGPFFVSRAAAPHLKAGGDGVIVSISSLAGITGTGSSIAYAASKGRVEHHHQVPGPHAGAGDSRQQRGPRPHRHALDDWARRVLAAGYRPQSRQSRGHARGHCRWRAPADREPDHDRRGPGDGQRLRALASRSGQHRNPSKKLEPPP